MPTREGALVPTIEGPLVLIIEGQPVSIIEGPPVPIIEGPLVPTMKGTVPMEGASPRAAVECSCVAGCKRGGGHMSKSNAPCAQEQEQEEEEEHKAGMEGQEATREEHWSVRESATEMHGMRWQSENCGALLIPN